LGVLPTKGGRGESHLWREKRKRERPEDRKEKEGRLSLAEKEREGKNRRGGKKGVFSLSFNRIPRAVLLLKRRELREGRKIKTFEAHIYPNIGEGLNGLSEGKRGEVLRGEKEKKEETLADFEASSTWSRGVFSFTQKKKERKKNREGPEKGRPGGAVTPSENPKKGPFFFKKEKKKDKRLSKEREG